MTSSGGPPRALVEHVRANAPRYFPDMGAESADARLVWSSERDNARLYRLELSGRAGTVSQIAYKVGFSRPEYFMRIFKQHTGLTPGQFMKEAP